jgi:hypothetical protein
VHDWEDGLRLLISLEQLRLRSWRSLRETPSSEDGFIRTWLINSPQSLSSVKIWTKAYTGGAGERLTTWSAEVVGRWRKDYEQEGEVDESDFL